MLQSFAAYYGHGRKLQVTKKTQVKQILFKLAEIKGKARKPLKTLNSQYLFFVFDYSLKCHEPVDDSFALKGN